MAEPRITREQLLAWGPCCRKPGERYCDAELDRLFNGRESLTPGDVAALDIPREDVVWVWTRDGALPEDVRASWIERIVTRAVEYHALRCGVPEVEQWAAEWLDGSSRTPAAATRAAARAARAWEETSAEWAADAAWEVADAAWEATRAADGATRAAESATRAATSATNAVSAARAARAVE